MFRFINFWEIEEHMQICIITALSIVTNDHSRKGAEKWYLSKPNWQSTCQWLNGIWKHIKQKMKYKIKIGRRRNTKYDIRWCRGSLLKDSRIYKAVTQDHRLYATVQVRILGKLLSHVTPKRSSKQMNLKTIYMVNKNKFYWKFNPLLADDAWRHHLVHSDWCLEASFGHLHRNNDNVDTDSNICHHRTFTTQYWKQY